MTRGKRPRVGLLALALLGVGANLASAQPGTTREPPTGPAPLLVGLSPLSITPARRPSGPSPATIASEIEPIVRVVAAVDAESGVRPPIRVHARPDPIALPLGTSARIVVGIGRESGYDRPVELRVEGLPEGVRVSGHSVVPKGEAVGTVRLVRDATAPPIAREVAVRVVGVARMPRGPVSVDSAIRPMVRETLVEEY